VLACVARRCNRALGACEPCRVLHDTKPCATCGRSFAWRKSLAKVWDEVRYCSDACRRQRPGPRDRALEAAIIALLDERARGATICPSEAARRVAGADEAAWRALMEPARRAARRLVVAGAIEVLQGGRAVDPSRAKGPIRLRRAASG